MSAGWSSLRKIEVATSWYAARDDHKAITNWRRKQALLRTMKRRPDLMEKADLSAADRKILDEIELELDGN